MSGNTAVRKRSRPEYRSTTCPACTAPLSARRMRKFKVTAVAALCSLLAFSPVYATTCFVTDLDKTPGAVVIAKVYPTIIPGISTFHVVENVKGYVSRPYGITFRNE